MTGHVYSSLTRELDDPRSPLRRHLETRFPTHAYHQKLFRDSAGAIVVPGAPTGTGVDPGTVGTAFHLAVSLALDPDRVPSGVWEGVQGETHEAVSAVHEVAELVRGRVSPTEPLPEDVARACWALALCDEASRTSGAWEGGVLEEWLESGKTTAGSLLDLVPEGGAEQLVGLHQVATTTLYPQLPARPTRVELGPSFECSKICNADADLIIDGLLLEIKTQQGRKSATGLRWDRLSKATLHQLLGYILFDTNDRYSITQVGVYSARFAHLVVFSLEEFLSNLSSPPPDLAHERKLVAELLAGS